MSDHRRGRATLSLGHLNRPRLRRLAPYLFVLPTVIYLFALLVYPIILNVTISFQHLSLGNLLSGGAPWAGLANYEAAASDALFMRAARHSVIYSVASVATQLVIGLGLALFYSRGFPGAVSLRSLYLIGYAIPIVVVAQLFRWLLDGRTGLVNWLLQAVGLQENAVFWLANTSTALPAVIAIQIWLGVPFVMIVLLAGLTSIPSELKEAAAIDGAGGLGQFRYVTWPLLRPTFLAAGVLSMIFTFKTFDVVWIATRGGPANASEILPTLAYRLVFTQFQFGKGAAILNLMFIVLFLLSLAYLLIVRRERQWT